MTPGQIPQINNSEKQIFQNLCNTIPYQIHKTIVVFIVNTTFSILTYHDDTGRIDFLEDGTNGKNRQSLLASKI